MSYDGKLNIIVKTPYSSGLYSYEPEEQSIVPPPSTSYLLQENGFFLTQENGEDIIIT